MDIVDKTRQLQRSYKQPMDYYNTMAQRHACALEKSVASSWNKLVITRALGLYHIYKNLALVATPLGLRFL